MILFAVLFIPIPHFPHLFMHEIHSTDLRYSFPYLYIWDSFGLLLIINSFRFILMFYKTKHSKQKFFFFASKMYEKKNWKCNLMWIKLKQGWLWIYFHFYSFYHCNVGKSCLGAQLPNESAVCTLNCWFIVYFLVGSFMLLSLLAIIVVLMDMFGLTELNNLRMWFKWIFGIVHGNMCKG